MQTKKEMLLNRLNKVRQKIYLSNDAEELSRTYEDDFCKIVVEVK
jgi:hypothetical protein